MNFNKKIILAAYGASFVTKNSLAQKPIDVVSDDLADDFKDLQRNRYSKENLPKLPDLPPPSPTNALILPEEPQPVSLASIYSQISQKGKILLRIWQNRSLF